MKRVLISFLLSGFMLQAYANDAVWVPITMAVCMEQDSSNKETVFGKGVMQQGAAYEESNARKYASCLAKKVSPMPDKLCKTLLNQTAESSASLDINALFQTYERDVTRLANVQGCGMQVEQ